MINAIHNESCFETMKRMTPHMVDIVLTSPPYNTNAKQGKNSTLANTPAPAKGYHYLRYDVHVDTLSNAEYCERTASLFREFDRIVKPNGVILYNLSYGNENTECMIEAVAAIMSETPFTLADVIVWRKTCALPNTCSPNRLTRIAEFVFVFCRKTETRSFHANKRQLSTRETGQTMFESIYNVIEAPNNDGPCPFNKATYSSALCERLLTIYAPPHATIYDPFMGSGTTAYTCKRLGLDFIGSEISPNQVAWANKRLEQVQGAFLFPA